METVHISEQISRCENVQELKDFVIPNLQTQQEQWSIKIKEIIEQSKLTKKEFAEMCGVSRVCLDKWCKGSIPRERENFFRIGMLANYDVNQMNHLLQRYGRHSALYSKSLEDCICIYVLQKKMGMDAVNQYNYITSRIKDIFCRDEQSQKKDVKTEEFDKNLAEIQENDELECFITDNVATFSTAYHKFYSFINVYIKTNFLVYDSKISALANSQGWTASLRRCVSEINNNKWYPTRNKIISLGIHLNMDHEQIDTMLKLAHMEPLCAKNIFESIIMFILDDASLNNVMEGEVDELCNYTNEVLEEFDLPEIEKFITEIKGAINE